MFMNITIHYKLDLWLQVRDIVIYLKISLRLLLEQSNFFTFCATPFGSVLMASCTHIDLENMVVHNLTNSKQYL